MEIQFLILIGFNIVAEQEIFNRFVYIFKNKANHMGMILSLDSWDSHFLLFLKKKAGTLIENYYPL